MSEACPFCEGAGGAILWQNALCRVVLAEEPLYPGFCRVILARHAVEMTQLAAAERARLMEVVFAVEEAVRETMRPDKVNLASLGNMVPHVHWHVIPRFRDDAHFPGAIWAERKREATVPAGRAESARRIGAAVRARLEGIGT